MTRSVSPFPWVSVRSTRALLVPGSGSLLVVPRSRTSRTLLLSSSHGVLSWTGLPSDPGTSGSRSLLLSHLEPRRVRLDTPLEGSQWTPDPVPLRGSPSDRTRSLPSSSPGPPGVTGPRSDPRHVHDLRPPLRRTQGERAGG